MTRIPISTVQAHVAHRYGLRIEAMTCERKTKRLVGPRQIAMYLADRLSDRHTTVIGEHFGGRDHSTVFNACRRVAARRAAHPIMEMELSDIETRLRAGL
jgi:chromosomal replication initiator protein